MDMANVEDFVMHKGAYDVPTPAIAGWEKSLCRRDVAVFEQFLLKYAKSFDRFGGHSAHADGPWGSGSYSEAGLSPRDKQEPRNARALADDQDPNLQPGEGGRPPGCSVLQAHVHCRCLFFLPLLGDEHLAASYVTTAVPSLL